MPPISHLSEVTFFSLAVCLSYPVTSVHLVARRKTCQGFPLSGTYDKEKGPSSEPQHLGIPDYCLLNTM
jgi:hypothetical protein